MMDPVWALWAVAGAAGLAALFSLLAWIRSSPARQLGDPRIDQILAGQERLERAGLFEELACGCGFLAKLNHGDATAHSRADDVDEGAAP